MDNMSFPFGKVMPEILKNIVFNYLGAKDKSVLVGPSFGEDAAIINIGENILAVSCDPISGAESRIGWLAVNISANDVVTRGVKPRWFLPCVLLPKGSDKNLLREICDQMDKAAKALKIAIVGGHTETTPGISHPLVIGFCAGFSEKGKFVSCSGAVPGSKIILTKGAGIEGTAILAAERFKILEKKFGENFIINAEKYFNLISVVEEALLAYNYGGVLAMHDPTEGGVAGALHEMAEASGTGFNVYEDKIYISPDTKKICDFFMIDPLKLISSGALLLATKPDKAKTIVNTIRMNGINASVIGEFLEDKNVRTIVKNDGSVHKLVMPESDDLWVALNR
jgi:hydrogenase expression/formation protein HypE